MTKRDQRVIARMSETGLYNLLDKLYDEGKENTEEYQQIDAELDRRAQKSVEAEKAKKQKEKEQKERREELKRQVDELKKKNKRGTMAAMVAEFGDEFRDDYYINGDNEVRSLCDSSKYRLEKIDCWGPYEDINDAAVKVDQLIYYRVYDNYFRHGPTDEVFNRLMTKIIEMSED